MTAFSKAEKKILSVYPNLVVREEKGCIVLEGELDDYADVVNAGKLAVNKKAFLGVINRVKLKGFTPSVRLPEINDNKYDGLKPDVVIVGGGVVGTAIARELSKWKLDIMLFEKEYDVAIGASGRNDGCVHVGIDLKPGQQKLKYNGWGNSLYDELCKDLGVKFERTGHILFFSKKWERILVPAFYIQAALNHIKGVKYYNDNKLRKIEPGLPSWAHGGIYMPSGGIVSPYKLTVALAENAASNDVKICLDTAVLDIKTEDDKVVSVKTNRGTVYPKILINAAGVYADVIADLAGDRTFTIHPRKGINMILDKKVGYFTRTSMTRSPFSPDPYAPKAKGLIAKLKRFDSIIFSKSHTKGGGVVHTSDKNVLVGPNAIEIPEREDYSTDIDSINAIYDKQHQTAEKMKKSDVITYFAGVRAPTYEEDFVVRKGIYTKNVIEAAGIQSPGLTAAPAIGVEVSRWAVEMLVEQGVKVENNVAYNPIRKPIPHLAEMDEKERDALIKQNPDYGVIICRCEEISKGEILDALKSPVPVYTVDAVKRRCRPGMGRCQGGFCSPLVMQIISEYTGKSLSEVKKAGAASTVLFGDTKGGK